MQPIEAGVFYFALVFGAGFVLGTLRTLWLVPHVGTRTAELMETPIMLVVTIFVARWTVLRLAVPAVGSAGLGMGCIALFLPLVAEFGLMLRLRRLTIPEHLARGYLVAGTATVGCSRGLPPCRFWCHRTCRVMRRSRIGA